jgi:Chaperone of endosialidase
MKNFMRGSLLLLLLVNASAMAQNWTVTGNNLSTNGRLGTNNSRDVLFETNNAVRGKVTRTGLWGFGINTPTGRVHIGSAAGQNPLNVQVGADMKLFVDAAGGTSIGGVAIPPVNGLLVAGNTGVGALPGSYKFKVTHGTFGFNIENATTLDDWELWTNSGGLSLYANGNFRGNFNPTTGAYTAVSDERAKTNIQAMPAVLDKVKRLKPSTYQMLQGDVLEDPTEAYGFVAQDVATVFPHLVSYHYDGERHLDSYSMDYAGFGVLAIKAIQELEARVAALEAELGRGPAKR